MDKSGGTDGIRTDDAGEPRYKVATDATRHAAPSKVRAERMGKSAASDRSNCADITFPPASLVNEIPSRLFGNCLPCICPGSFSSDSVGITLRLVPLPCPRGGRYSSYLRHARCHRSPGTAVPGLSRVGSLRMDTLIDLRALLVEREEFEGSMVSG